MKTYCLITISLLLAVTSCYKQHENRTINYDEDQVEPLTIDSILTDTSRVLMADFPLFFDSTRILIHTVGFVDVEVKKRNRGYIKGSYDSDISDYGMNLRMGKDNIRGNITYMIFEDVDNNIIRPLTKDVLNITNVEYLRELAKKTNRHYLLYTLQDRDTNRDGKINGNDITSLYISKLDGTSFAKISPDFHQLDDYELRTWSFRCYFRTMEDVNKDGKFNKKDKYHYYYIDFSADPYKVIEYNPLDHVLK